MEWMALPFRRYADFSGRSRRKEYFMFVLLHVIVMVMLMAIASLDSASELVGIIAMLFFIVWVLATFVPALAVQVRRFHDQNRSAWWLLLNLVPWIGSVLAGVFMLMDGTPGPNLYGADPKGRNEEGANESW